MKKITIGVMLLFALSTTVKAQDYKKVREALVLAQVPGTAGSAKLEEAKAQLDKVLADPKAEGKAETYLLKAEVLGSIAGNDALKAKYPGADAEGLQSLKKYYELEPSGEKIKAEPSAANAINSLSNSFTAGGNKYFNSKNWDSAFSNYQKLAELSDMLIQYKMTNTAFDTTSNLYAGATAQSAKKNDEAAKYYAKIADRKIGGKDYEAVYQFLTQYYLNNNNQAQFKKYLALGKEVYPTNTAWNEFEFANTTENANIEDMAKKFQEADAAKTLDAKSYMDYADYFVNSKKIKDLDPAQRAPYLNMAFTAFSKAADLDTSNGLTSYNAGVIAYNFFQDASDSAKQIKGVTAAIKSKRAKADKQVDSAADKSIVWLEKSYNTLASKANRTKTETNVAGKAVDFLYNLAAYKRDRSKALNPKDYDKYDAKMKLYDSMHGKF